MHYTLSDYIVDLVQNSVEAKADEVTVDLYESQDKGIKVCISDNGCGMDDKTLARVRDPFFTDGIKHAKRRVGLGLSFLAQLADQCKGSWDITSEKNVGTSLSFSYDSKNIDAPPVGNLVNALVTLMGQPGEFELKFNRIFDDDSWAVSRSEVADALGDLRDAQALIALRKYLRSMEEELIENKKLFEQGGIDKWVK
ncbi:MAG: sensor histidine kinase [Chitinispirillales bacterium]|jgi:hypothetical protein|nr:sensor histidine kinase [Chitinispirillales bacterium]